VIETITSAPGLKPDERVYIFNVGFMKEAATRCSSFWRSSRTLPEFF